MNLDSGAENYDANFERYLDSQEKTDPSVLRRERLGFEESSNQKVEMD